VVHGLVQVAVPGGMMPRSMWDMAVRIGALEDLPGLGVVGGAGLVFADGNRWLLMAVRGHLGGTHTHGQMRSESSGITGPILAAVARAFLIMNLRSGGGKVAKFGLKQKAEALGAEVALLEGPGEVDVAALARQAGADGADLLGVAGGDGPQALVAGIAAEHGLAFLVISAGTRNEVVQSPAYRDDKRGTICRCCPTS